MGHFPHASDPLVFNYLRWAIPPNHLWKIMISRVLYSYSETTP